jgi:hypothetical protein
MPRGNKSFPKVSLCSGSWSLRQTLCQSSPQRNARYSPFSAFGPLSIVLPVFGPCSESNAGVGVSFFWVLMVGIAYQRSPYDPFENATQCQLDAALMKTLGANAIRSTVSCPQFISLQSLLPILSVLSFGLLRGKSAGKLLSACPRGKPRNCAST